MTPAGLNVETEWLHTVLDALEQSGRPTSRAAIERLRDRLMTLAWADSAPRAQTFLGRDEDVRFRRHPLATVEAHGCSALLMYWPPGHATVPHDHDGLWGIELVIDGTLSINEFVRVSDDDAAPLAPTKTLHLGIGDAALFDGGRYVHRCRNLSNAHPTLTLHVYGGALTEYTSWRPDASGRVVAQREAPSIDRPL